MTTSARRGEGALQNGDRRVQEASGPSYTIHTRAGQSISCNSGHPSPDGHPTPGPGDDTQHGAEVPRQRRASWCQRLDRSTGTGLYGALQMSGDAQVADCKMIEASFKRYCDRH
ncbi:unnamed protein product [Arctogadus glacialis]